MNFKTITGNSFRALAVSLAAAFALAACDDESVPIDVSGEIMSNEVSPVLELSSLDAPVGSRITIAVRADHPELAALQGRLTYRPDRLEYLGQEPQAHLALINSDRFGDFPIVSMSVTGLPARTAILSFEVLQPGYTDRLAYQADEAVRLNEELLQVSRRAEIQWAPGQLASAEPRMMNVDDWQKVLYPELAAQRPVTSWLPGQDCVPNTNSQGDPNNITCGPGNGTGAGPTSSPFEVRYGDVNLNNAVDGTDALFLALIANGTNVIIDSLGDAAVAGNSRPANSPGLGESGDAMPPGWETTTSGRTFPGGITSADALGAAFVAAGLPAAVVDSVIPGRENRGPNVVVNIAGGEYSNAGAVPPAPNPDCTSYNAGTATWTWRGRTAAGAQCIIVLDSIVTVGNEADNTAGGALNLEIQAGARIEGDAPSALFIARNGRIFARGTRLEPIVLTCLRNGANPTCEAADWGGFWIAGNANVVEGQAALGTNAAFVDENGVSRTVAGCNQREGEGGATIFGGCNRDDNSGVIEYMITAYGGREVLPNNELNTFTLGGVGRGTTVNNVFVAFGSDDCTEIFGGSVNVTHLINYQCIDDHVDLSFGYVGFMQYVLTIRDPAISDHGVEADNTETLATYENGNGLSQLGASGTVDADNAVTAPTIANCTFIGGGDTMLNIRRGTATRFINCIGTNFGNGLVVSDDATCTNNLAGGATDANPFGTGIFQIRGWLLNGFATLGGGALPAGCQGIIGGVDGEDWLLDPSFDNAVVAGSCLRDPSAVVGDYRPTAGCATNATIDLVTHANPVFVAGRSPEDDAAIAFFDIPSQNGEGNWVGAFQPCTNAACSAPIPWSTGWTAIDGVGGVQN
jgi:hypothetical protein